MMLRARREGEEPQVPDEQLRSNEHLRHDEIHVHCEIPDGITVSAELFQGVDDDLKSRFFHTFSVQYLPPMSLTCLMPLSYPSHHPPYFTLSVQWLDSVKISSLCHMLDSIWAQQPGQEIVYEWVQWLQSYALSHVSDIMMGPVDVRAVRKIASVESVVQCLISYNEEQCQESFLSAFHDCMICFSEHPGNDFIKLPCLHYYCRKCMETYSRMHVKEGTVMDLFCPYDKCQGVIPPNLLKRLLVDVTYCPRCETACLEDEENNAQCSKCFFSFCTLCRERRHIGDRCMTPEEKLLSLQDRQKMCGSSRGKAGKEIDLFNQLLSIKEVLRDTVQCPHCDIYVSRVSGCDHMYCGNCRNGFCYGCGKPLDNHRMYCTLLLNILTISSFFIARLKSCSSLKVSNADLISNRSQ
ncbi:hypothetical protein HU200_063298 [Digitaria exilis]|uniref:RBR-type E3 ubiquitin transferase n=1 Tax=Digitaria exilis TaxID=1010633 RepID=A0A835DVD6_9POAL|nr:hypothetical protein HU200_063298 [Digitaria exilis]